ncbi:WD repeat-containing protein 89 [Fopius arisanus]|uniref:WD repeat-containing protein 89 n=1 Tax=Fopius arisanus TaxID=64838 RepID=A0A9R1TLA1_9HYME|nr:PREDICTED: WD repeat-containing protein 89 [Fopius arisanus]
MPRVVESTRKRNGNSESHNTSDNDKSQLINRSEMIVSMEDSCPGEDNYVLALCGTQHEPEFRFCAGLSDYSCIVYNVNEGLSKIATLSHNTSPIVGIKFSPSSKNILYTATRDGHITACDLRAKGKVVADMTDGPMDGKLKPLASFDISSDDKLIAAGTEHVGGDAFILFWDIRCSSVNNSRSESRKNDLLGGYWESHMDDVTSLAFHPAKANTLASGSTDGLINVFDLKMPTEDSALTYSLNTESSVDRLGWLEDDHIWCTTHTHCLQLWECEDATPYGKYDRTSIAANFMNENPDSCYLVRVHRSASSEDPFLLTGSTVKGDHLHGLTVTSEGMKWCSDFTGNKQLVRDSWYHAKSGWLITGGEGGIINLWKQNDTNCLQANGERKSLMKSTGKSNGRDKHRTKPY